MWESPDVTCLLSVERHICSRRFVSDSRHNDVQELHSRGLFCVKERSTGARHYEVEWSRYGKFTTIPDENKTGETSGCGCGHLRCIMAAFLHHAPIRGRYQLNRHLCLTCYTCIYDTLNQVRKQSSIYLELYLYCIGWLIDS